METKDGKAAKSWKGLFTEGIQGDKVIWIVFIMLILYSLVVNFSATPLKVTATRSRLDIFGEHIMFVAGSFVLAYLIYRLMKVGLLRVLSSLGFIVSIILLGMLLCGFHTVVEDSAARSIRLFGFDLQVYEFVKLFMVMYLSWAVNAYKYGSFWITDKLAERFKRLRFLTKPIWKRIVYIHLPIILVTLCIMVSGFSSAMFTAVIMILTVLVGGIPWKDIGGLLALVAAAVLIVFAAWKLTGADFIGRRWKTVEKRIEAFVHPKKIDDFTPGSNEYNVFIDENRQPEGAKIAIKEGGLFGKWVGKSTQKYSIAEMYSDYAFAFVIEEYGILLGALPLLAIYLCLLGRGTIISRYCTNHFCKTAVAGLTLLISGQAMLHMCVNVGIGPLTGQTLPIVSYGRSSLVVFATAFGILLCISRTAYKQVEEAQNAAAPLVDRSDDEVSDAMNDLDSFESEM